MAGGAVLPEPIRLLFFDDIDSTNEEARRQCLAGAAAPLMIWATRQNKGRGRHGRKWYSPEGNLYCSLLLDADFPLQQAAQLSFVAGLAVYDAVDGLFDAALPARGLKWPNDLLIDDKKIAGLLLETIPGRTGKPGHLVIGVGINITTYPVDTPYPASALSVLGARPSTPQTLLADYGQAFWRWYNIWLEDGFAPVRDGWKKAAVKTERWYDVRTGTRNIIGRFKDLDESGALVLEDEDGQIHKIDAGDVYFSE